MWTVIHYHLPYSPSGFFLSIAVTSGAVEG